MEQAVQVNPKKKKNLLSKIFTYFFGGLIALLLVFQLSGSISAQSNFGVPSFFGYQTLIVLTDSMEPTIKVDDAIIIHKVDLSTIQSSSSIEAHDGDVITFYRQADGLIVTHRVIEVIVEQGTYRFKTLGDNLNAQTCPTGGCNPDIHFDVVEGKDVLGVVVGKSPIFGKVVSSLTNPFTIAIVAVIPLTFLFISSIVDIVKTSKMKPEAFEVDEDDVFEEMKRQEKLKLLIEIEKEKMRAEIAAQNNIAKEQTEHESNPKDE